MQSKRMVALAIALALVFWEASVATLIVEQRGEYCA
ncbi:MAG: hypothetical protein DDT35_00936 [Firmicutes bacterium]|nr:hypothetical protein [Bacillota bacterium]